MSSKNKLSAITKAKSVDILQRQLTSAIDLYLKIRQAHWNVKGSNFLSVHGLLGDIYGRVADQADDMAERIVQLGGIANGSSVKDIKSTTTSSTTIAGMIAGDLAAYSADLLEAFNDTTKIGDHGTANLLIDFCNFVDKDVWLLESTL